MRKPFRTAILMSRNAKTWKLKFPLHGKMRNPIELNRCKKSSFWRVFNLMNLKIVNDWLFVILEIDDVT